MDRRTFIKSSALITAAAASNSVFAELDKCNTIEENSINKGAKFYRNGKVAEYKGCSIICHTDKSSNLFKSMLNVQVKIQRDFGDCIVLLPPDSYHMTIIELVSGVQRTPWPYNTPTDIGMEEVREKIKLMLTNQQLAFDRPVRMKINLESKPSLPSEWDDNKQPAFIIPLIPASKSDKEILTKFRDRVAKITGVRKSNHDTYRFHTSFGYQIKPMTEKKYIQFTKEYYEWLNYLKTNSEPITFRNPALCYFNDMLQFDNVLDFKKS
ncbi:DUF1868 domain-containing protein [Escherichia coli]|uniref:DUF1868 domain-containing protein n=1 Tax=Escherichia coli TaxID=562 RepID=UPI0006A62D5C|nr:DUF1868 domain-containing protein [Escherichia coli]EFO5511104.1 DUF1868 domain-containing protein [Salmonella enterica]EKF4173040.1 DUF1868 domain-containing protein [Escherichia coli O26:H11]EFL9960630.1 DUF1868 domain-containing protein [Escherichia coli]EFO5828019.1 DUF1868 domain-containing protein [Salmonella enterica]EFO6044311.1 DUF1868 domain-containing protein [Salmonella enterica]